MANEVPSGDSVPEMAQLGRVFHEHRPRLLAMLRRRIDPALARRIDPEDVLGKAFLVAIRRWPVFAAQAEANAYPWLYGLTVDCLIEEWRIHTRGPRDLRNELPWPDRSSLQIGFGLVQSGTSPSDALARDEMRVSMKRVLELLPQKDRELLRMRHEDELSHAEVGQVLGMSPAAAAQAYIRALARLRKLWNQVFPSEEPT
jgi:RNA polymerase sigma-70 factor (ECF subfamily)